VNEARRCVDALAAFGYRADPVAMGISGGGLVCSYFAALDDRVRACCVSGFANTYRGSVLAMAHCVDNFQPGLLHIAEMPDVLSLIAPRPMIWESGERDPIFPIERVEEAARTVRSVYATLGAQSLFVVDRFDGNHRIKGALAYDFLWEHANGCRGAHGASV
jgi:pimeloyl-ACP methyl ester carboxylesterase